MSHNQQIEINMRGHKIRELELEILRLTDLLRQSTEMVDAAAGMACLCPKINKGKISHRNSCTPGKAQLLLDKLAKFKEKP